MFENLFNFMPKPFDEGFLPQREGHSIHYLQYGNPTGIPVLSFHGGPGGRSRPKYAKLFDLKKYRFLQFDQRGCGLSEAKDVLKYNETDYLIADAVHLLAYLRINTPVIVHGCSWGATMALLFAEAQPKMVSKIIVSSVFLARPYDYMWVNRDSERFYPDLWDEMRKQVKRNDIFDEYERLLFSTRSKDNIKAVNYWGSYEYMLGQLKPKFEKEEVTADILKAARIAFLYNKNQYFISPNQIINNAAKLKGVKTLILHNRMDFCCPVKQAWDLHKALPNSELHIVADYGHSSKKLVKECKRQVKKFLR
ncbi:MAG: alpha/beta fold hydrolase [Alphaproteobacteria bacterium]|nr:alpha/beta fold hydrolase [Alphaproteobacteria bacterium]